MIVTVSNYADFDKFQNVLFYISASNIYVHNHLYLEMNTEGTIKMLEEKVIGGPAPPPPPASDGLAVCEPLTKLFTSSYYNIY